MRKTNSEIDIELHKSIFNDFYRPFFEAPQHIQIFYGGASAGKSVFVSQRLVADLLRGDRNYLVVRNVARANRQSTFSQIKQIIDTWGINQLFDINKTDLTITCKNQQQAVFVGLDDVEKLKSILPTKGVFTDAWIEEATEIGESELLQIERRLRGKSKYEKRITMTFNPISRNHWIYTKFFADVPDKQQIYEDSDKLIIKATYKNNRFLTQQDVDILESEKNEYFYDVYTLGNWGILGDVIFTDWEVANVKKAMFANYRYGLDFGYANDPAAFVELAFDKKRKVIYVISELYERGLTNPDLATLVKPVCGRDYVYCDSAEPKSIAELRQHGINAIPAAKGKDSVLFGIQWLQQHRIVIDKHCQNAINEFQIYQWAKSKGGETLARPVDRNDHMIDAMRYALSDDMRGGRIVSGAKIINA